MQTLLTGFGPFGQVISNPTERLLDYFRDMELVGHELTTCLLPTSFTRAPQIMRAQLEVGGRRGRPFETILMLGVATNSPCWRVERMGRNSDNARLPDVDGFQPPVRMIAPDAPPILLAPFPVAAIVSALERANLPATPSNSAGAYLCNHLLFTTLHLLRARGDTAQAGFLHVPADERTFAPASLTNTPMFPFGQHVEAVRVTLTTLAAQANTLIDAEEAASPTLP